MLQTKPNQLNDLYGGEKQIAQSQTKALRQQLQLKLNLDEAMCDSKQALDKYQPNELVG